MPDEQPALPSRISRYRILGRLGSGGMGDVYAGLDETLQRRVALKSVKADRRLNTESQERFLREARILSQLDHPNICRAYDYIAGDDTDWLVMELVDGRSLADRIDEKPIGPAAIVIAEQIAAVLVVTHAAGIVHRDLKPGNVMITPAGDAKVLDFGIARSGEPQTPAPRVSTEIPQSDDVDDDTTRTSEPFSASAIDVDETRFQTEHASTIGTLPYMSPEQARGETATPASDMFSFGLLLQEMITGRRAYPRDLNKLALIERVQHARTEPLPGSGDLVKLVRRLTSLAPSQRPTAIETVERLRWIRDTSKRLIRRTAAAAMILAVVLASLKYTFDLRRERTAALLAEADANRRRGQAEGLIGFMLDDLRSKLEKAGRLDLLEAVGGQAITYFASVPASTLTGEELSRRAQTLYQIGAVRQARGDLKGAREAYDESLAVATQVAARDPSNADWQLRLATAHFYAGDIRRRESEFPGAMREFEAYRDIAAALVKRDPNNQTWALELSYAQGGIAAVQELQGDLDGARKALELALQVKEQITAHDPQKVGSAAGPRRRPTIAWAWSSTSWARPTRHAIITRPTWPSAARWSSATRTISHSSEISYRAIDFVAQSHEDGGDLPAALTQYQAAFDVIAPLAAGDPLNADWQRDRATAERRLGDVLSEMGRANEARSRYQQALATITPIAAATPTDVVRQRDAAKVEIGLGMIELGRGNIAAARQAAIEVERLLRAFYNKKPEGLSASLLAEGQLLSADAAARSGDAKTARTLREAVVTLTRGVPGLRSTRVRADEARALLALGRIDEARPIVTELWRLGYRHRVLVAAWTATGGEPLG